LRPNAEIESIPHGRPVDRIPEDGFPLELQPPFTRNRDKGTTRTIKIRKWIELIQNPQNKEPIGFDSHQGVIRGNGPQRISNLTQARRQKPRRPGEGQFPALLRRDPQAKEAHIGEVNSPSIAESESFRAIGMKYCRSNRLDIRSSRLPSQ
jgi:hypothetical protein